MKSFGEHFSSEMCNFLGLQIENPGSDPVISVRTPPKKSFSHQNKKCFQTLNSKHELNLDQARESREEDGGGGKEGVTVLYSVRGATISQGGGVIPGRVGGVISVK